MNNNNAKLGFKQTVYAGYIGYIVQSIVNNLAPLLFLIFRDTYSIPLSKITLIVTVNFLIQLAVDYFSTKFVDKIGYRVSVVAAHVFSAAGLIGLAVFVQIFPTPYMGIMTAVVIYALGGGLIEVLISPIIEACPTDNKTAAMSLLGQCCRCRNIDAVFAFCRQGQMAGACFDLGNCADFKRNIFLQSADKYPHRGGRRHEQQRAVQKQDILAVCAPYGDSRRKRTGDESMGVCICRKRIECVENNRRPCRAVYVFIAYGHLKSCKRKN